MDTIEGMPLIVATTIKTIWKSAVLKWMIFFMFVVFDYDYLMMQR